jgi:hypothetical protein
VLRACPCSDERQALLSYRVELSPGASVVTYQDYFGTRRRPVRHPQPHRSLEVAAEIRVAMSGRRRASRRPRAARSGPLRREHWEYLVPSRTSPSARHHGQARDVIAGVDDAPRAAPRCANTCAAPSSTHRARR